MHYFDEIKLKELKKYFEKVNDDMKFLGTLLCLDDGSVLIRSKNVFLLDPAMIDLESTAATLIPLILKDKKIRNFGEKPDLTLTFKYTSVHANVVHSFKYSLSLVLINAIPRDITKFEHIINEMSRKTLELLFYES